MPSSGLGRRVALVRINVSEDRIVSIIWVKGTSELETEASIATYY
jgi:hypothetical protein